MGRRKHAWAAYECLDHLNEDAVVLQRAQRLVEGATLEDFTDAVLERIGEMVSLAEETQSRHVALGMRLAVREILQVQDDWTIRKNPDE